MTDVILVFEDAVRSFVDFVSTVKCGSLSGNGLRFLVSLLLTNGVFKISFQRYLIFKSFCLLWIMQRTEITGGALLSNSTFYWLRFTNREIIKRQITAPPFWRGRKSKTAWNLIPLDNTAWRVTNGIAMSSERNALLPRLRCMPHTNKSSESQKERMNMRNLISPGPDFSCWIWASYSSWTHLSITMQSGGKMPMLHSQIDIQI